MADQMRLLKGEISATERFAVDSGTVIEVGDLLFLDTDDVKPASDQADQGTESDNKSTFANNFAGVAMQSSEDGETQDILVATAGEFAMDCISSTFEHFDLVSVEADATTAGATSDQHVESTTTNAEAIARTTKRYGSATTEVRVRLLPIEMTRLSAF